ncbi:hypothetical protein GCM10027429_25650 [Marivirga atlantica]
MAFENKHIRMKIFKYIVIFLLLIAAAGTVTFFVLDKPLPEGEQGPRAEALADRMLEAINDSAWQATGVVSWNYQDIHDFVWDKDRSFVKVSWEQYDVFVNLSTKQGKAYAKSKLVKDSSATVEFVTKAYNFWANDSFWLNPISKIRDRGTKRSLINLDQPNKTGLLVTYQSGGVTPGDSYLYVVDEENYRPEAIKMWVSIIPIGGIEFSWEEYVKTETGAIISVYHDGPIGVKINGLKTYSDITAFEEGDIFEVLN